MKKSILCMAAALVFPLQGQALDNLEQYKNQYQQGLTAADTGFREKRLAMPAAQVLALRQLEAVYQRAGNLSAMLTVQKERERFVLDPRGSSMPNLQAPPELAKLLENYKARFREIAVERDRAVHKLNVQYRVVLGKLQITLTQQGQIDDAKQVMQELESLGEPPAPPPPPEKAAVPLQPAAASSSTASAPGAPAAAPGKPTAADDEFFKDWFE